MFTNVVSTALATKIGKTKYNNKNPEPLEERLTKLFEKLGLSHIMDWIENNQDDVKSLMEEFQYLFALNDLELGKTSLVKHLILN